MVVHEDGRRPLEPRVDADGTIWRQAYCSAGATAKTPVVIKLNSTGYSAVASASGVVGYIGVPAANVASGATAWLQTGGLAEDVIAAASGAFTVNNGVVISKANTQAASAAFSYGTAGCFGVVASAGSATSKLHDIFMIDRVITVQN